MQQTQLKKQAVEIVGCRGLSTYSFSQPLSTIGIKEQIDEPLHPAILYQKKRRLKPHKKSYHNYTICMLACTFNLQKRNMRIHH
ncbi:hypothetical protein Hanom_Chr02g00124471 [Helianthus anomalus]